MDVQAARSSMLRAKCGRPCPSSASGYAAAVISEEHMAACHVRVADRRLHAWHVLTTSRQTIYFWHIFGACRRRTAEGPDRIGWKRRRGLGWERVFGRLQIDACPRRSPSACSEILKKKARGVAALEPHAFASRRTQPSCSGYRLYIGSTSASPTACPLRGYGRAGTQSDRLGAPVWACRYSK